MKRAPLDRLGMVQVASGQPEVARTTWHQALTIIQAVGAPEAEAVAECLMPSVGDGPGQ